MSDASVDGGDSGAFGIWGPGSAELCAAAEPACDQGSCGDGLSCVAGGCQGGYCTFAGSTCVDASKCPEGADCVPTARTSPNGPIKVCVSPSGSCVDSRTCPREFKCERDPSDVGHCVDRRMPCRSDQQCPTGFSCVAVSGAGSLYCAFTMVTCQLGSGTCPVSGHHCVDLFGTGQGICYPPGSCSKHSDCPKSRCGIEPMTRRAACAYNTGACTSSSQCLSGTSCVDAFDTGVSVCQSGGPCQYDHECPANGHCFAPTGSGNGLPICACFQPESATVAACP